MITIIKGYFGTYCRCMVESGVGFTGSWAVLGGKSYEDRKKVVVEEQVLRLHAWESMCARGQLI